MSADHINAFCLSNDGTIIFAGDKGGRIWVIDSKTFEVVSKTQAHVGTIQAMFSHQSFSHFAVIGKDRSVSVWEYAKNTTIRKLVEIDTREISTDDYVITHHEGQNITLHPTQKILATTTGNLAVAEFDYSNPSEPSLISCQRLPDEGAAATLRYHDGRLIAGTVNGRILVCGEGIEQHRFDGICETFHWFEPITDGSLICACDARKVFRFFPDDATRSYWGPTISRDDFEHIVYDRNSGYAYATSFDRNVYEIDIETLDRIRIVYQAEFKLRWIRMLPHEPGVFVLQVRNGSLLKIRASDGKELCRIKETPPALWSIATGANRIFLAGEGRHIYEMNQSGIAPDMLPQFRWKRHEFSSPVETYTKRILVSPEPSERIVAARTDGTILCGPPGNMVQLAQLDGAVRDIAFGKDSASIYAACESGSVYQISTDGRKSEKIFEHSEPIWSLAYNPQRNLLAYGERLGKLHIVDPDKAQLLGQSYTRLPKRMRWLNDSTLIVTHSGEVDRLDLTSSEIVHHSSYFSLGLNTVEDFDVSVDGRYLVLITYNKIISLFSIDTGTLLFNAYDGFDYMKGISFIGARFGGYETDFVTIGRSGYAKFYRIHDEQIFATGISWPDDIYATPKQRKK